MLTVLLPFMGTPVNHGQRLGKFIDKVGLETLARYIEAPQEELAVLKDKAKEVNKPALDRKTGN
ncbi:MAG: hypothetical protein ACOY4Q_05920 [Bacillota bacterium]